MLVLARKPSESVIIRVAGFEIRVMLVEMRSNNSRLGFEGPPEAVFIREELLVNDGNENHGPRIDCT